MQNSRPTAPEPKPTPLVGYEALVRASSDAIVTIDALGRIASWNRAAEHMFGHLESNILGRDLDLLLVDSLEPTGPLNTTHGSGMHLETQLRRRNGAAFPAEVSVATWQDVEGGFFTGLVIRDVSERLAAVDLTRRLEAKLATANKLEAIGELAAGIAHEINTPTQFIGDNVAFLHRAFDVLLEALEAKTDAPPSSQLAFLIEQVPDALAQTKEGIERVTNIVSAMKDFAHSTGNAAEPFDLHRAIQTTTTIARNEWKYVATVELVLDPTLPLVVGQRDQICQVILNLVVNAAQAMQEKYDSATGHIVISTQLDEADVVITVADDGPGMPPEVSARAFEPFFTTKGVGKGSGQGLAIARGIIEDRHGGSVRITSTGPAGTTFELRLPIEPTRKEAV